MIIETKTTTEHFTDLNKTLLKIIKELYPDIKNKKILLNTSFGHNIFVNIEEEKLEQLLPAAFRWLINLSPEKSHIVINTDTTENNNILKIKNNRIKQKTIAKCFNFVNKDVIDKKEINLTENNKIGNYIELSFPLIN